MENSKFYILVLSLFLFTCISQGQIVNGGFENWKGVEGNSQPIGWESQNEFRGIEQSILNASGQYAVRFLPCPTNLGRWQ